MSTTMQELHTLMNEISEKGLESNRVIMHPNAYAGLLEAERHWRQVYYHSQNHANKIAAKRRQRKNRR